MAYEPTNWKKGDVVTAAKLNKLENGVSNVGGVLVAHITEVGFDKTWSEVVSAVKNDNVVFAVESYNENEAAMYVLSGYGYYPNSPEYSEKPYILNFANEIYLGAVTAEDYPTPFSDNEP